VTTEAASRTPGGEAGFRLLAEHLPNLILPAFDTDELTCSDELCRVLGRPFGFRIAMRDLGQVLHPADLEQVTTAPGQGTVVEAKLPLAVPTDWSGP
jgi:hypothetical protein